MMNFQQNVHTLSETFRTANRNDTCPAQHILIHSQKKAKKKEKKLDSYNAFIEESSDLNA